jgi:cyclic pyranopterin phosphate synthase
VPRCLLGADAVHAYDPGSDRVKVVTPDAAFEFDRSKLAGSVHVAACEGGCAFRAICPGIRADYLSRFGAGEFAPVPPSARPKVQGGSGTS